MFLRPSPLFLSVALLHADLSYPFAIADLSYHVTSSFIHPFIHSSDVLALPSSCSFRSASWCFLRTEESSGVQSSFHSSCIRSIYCCLPSVLPPRFRLHFRRAPASTCRSTEPTTWRATIAQPIGLSYNTTKMSWCLSSNNNKASLEEVRVEEEQKAKERDLSLLRMPSGSSFHFICS